MKRHRKRKPNGQNEKIKNYLLAGNEIDPIKATQLGFGLNLSTRISNLRNDYGMKISQRAKNEKVPTGMQIYWMTVEQRDNYNQSTK